MTYAISLMLMTAGILLLVWTVAATMRLRRDREDVEWAVVRSFDALNTPSQPIARSERALADTAAPSWANWLPAAETRRRSVRHAPDLGGFTEVPLQVHDSYDQKVYIRRRIWMN